jgi:hypothetical protein
MKELSFRLLAVCLAVLAWPDSAAAAGVRLEQVTGSLVRPVDVAHAGDGSGRLFIALQTGVILIHDGRDLLDTPFLDISRRISCCGGRGILGMTFHPRYRRNGFFFVAFTNRRGNAVVARYSVSADPNVADPATEEVLLVVPQPYPGHNNGDIAFGPDRFLYLATGDGGAEGDPDDQAQNLGSLLGKILRIDVDSASPYAVPGDNPFRGTPAAQAEIWAYGLRYPWRFSFDRETGDLFIGDVGEHEREEIDFQPAESPGGENYGWRRMEGTRCFEPPSDCDDGTLQAPIVEYGHDVGCSVIGGFRYRGPPVPTLSRFYVYGDFCSGRIWGARPDSAGRWRSTLLGKSDLSIVSFGEDEAGNLYLVHLAGSAPSGAVYRLVGEPLFASGFETGGLADWSGARGRVAVVAPGLKRTGHALEVPIDGTDRRSFVEIEHRFDRNTFSASFLLNPKRVVLGDGEIEIARLIGPQRHVSLTLSLQGRKYFVTLLARTENNVMEAFGRARVPRNRAVRLELDWFRATARQSDDGEVRLLKSGKLKVAATGLANGSFSIDSVRLGLPDGSSGAPADGSFLIDEYVASP